MTQPLIPTKALEAQLPFSALRAQRAQSLMNFSEWLGEQIADSPESNAEANFEVEIPPPLESAMPAWEHPALTSSPEVADALADDSAFLMPQLSAAPQVEEFTPDQLAAAIPDTTLLPQPSKTQLPVPAKTQAQPEAKPRAQWQQRILEIIQKVRNTLTPKSQSAVPSPALPLPQPPSLPPVSTAELPAEVGDRPTSFLADATWIQSSQSPEGTEPLLDSSPTDEFLIVLSPESPDSNDRTIFPQHPSTDRSLAEPHGVAGHHPPNRVEASLPIRPPHFLADSQDWVADHSGDPSLRIQPSSDPGVPLISSELSAVEQPSLGSVEDAEQSKHPNETEVPLIQAPSPDLTRSIASHPELTAPPLASPPLRSDPLSETVQLSPSLPKGLPEPAPSPLQTGFSPNWEAFEGNTPWKLSQQEELPISTEPDKPQPKFEAIADSPALPTQSDSLAPPAQSLDLRESLDDGAVQLPIPASSGELTSETIQNLIPDLSSGELVSGTGKMPIPQEGLDSLPVPPRAAQPIQSQQPTATPHVQSSPDRELSSFQPETHDLEVAAPLVEPLLPHEPSEASAFAASAPIVEPLFSPEAPDQEWQRNTDDSDSKLQTPNSKLQTPNSGLRTPNSERGSLNPHISPPSFDPNRVDSEAIDRPLPSVYWQSDHTVPHLPELFPTETAQAIATGQLSPQGYAVGGAVVPSSSGHPIAPSDTVPAMLTPGEFVVRAKPAQEHLELLSHINQGGKVEMLPENSTKVESSDSTVLQKDAQPGIVQRRSIAGGLPKILKKLSSNALPLSTESPAPAIASSVSESVVPITPTPTDYSASPLIFRKSNSLPMLSDAVPDQWLSVQDLLFGDSESQPPTPYHAASLSNSITEIPYSSARVQGFVNGGEVQRPDTVTPTQPVTETITAPSGSSGSKDNAKDTELEVLAREVYHRLRERLELDRERHGYYSGRLPW
jgi:hypothetical protein